MTRRKQRLVRRRRGILLLVTVLVAAAVVGGLVAFEPWRVFTSSTVNEEIPLAATEAARPRETRPAPARRTPRSTTPAPPVSSAPTASSGPAVLASGRFVTQEHATTGRVRVLRFGAGDRYVRLDDFTTSDGPDLHVWITDQPAGGSWGKYDDGRFVRLGELKATGGNQNYQVPTDADLNGMRSVVIWCDRFNVAFGSAPLQS